MGKVFYDMGFLANASVQECSASDLIGQYVGHTGPKVIGMLDKALGRVLFIDEAYRLGDGQFGAEAVNELVDSLTKPRYANKLITILAGYNADIDRLMSVNPGLTSRFPETVSFENLTSKHAAQLLEQKLKKKGVEPAILERTFQYVKDQSLVRLDILSQLPGWGNARDINTLAKNIYALVLQQAENSSSPLVVDPTQILQALDAMVSEREARYANANQNMHSRDQANGLPTISLQQDPPKQHSFSQETASTLVTDKDQHLPPTQKEAPEEPPPPPPTQARDAGVSDATWQTLLDDKAAADRRAHELDAETHHQAETIRATEATIKEAAIRAEKLKAETEKAERKKGGDSEDREALEALKRRQEATRLAHLRALAVQHQAEAKLQAAQAEKKREAEAQRKLRSMGVCVAGFRWIKQASGYRCAGGTHFVSDAQLGMER